MNRESIRKSNRRSIAALCATAVSTCLEWSSLPTFADEAGESPAAPTILSAPELRALYGSDTIRFRMQGRVGKFTITAHPDGRLEGETTGFRPDSRQATGTWRVNEDGATVCYSWDTPRWASGCQRIERLGPDTYRYLFDDGTKGLQFSVAR